MNYYSILLGATKSKTVLPVYTNSKKTTNGHIALIGETGCGKTVQAQRICSSIVKSGGTVVVISQHNSFADSQIFEYYKNIINKYRNDIYVCDNGIPVHLFNPLRFTDGTFEKEIDTIGSITDIISRVLKLGDNQREILRTAVQYVMEQGSYKELGFRAIGDALRVSDSKEGKSLYNRMKYLFDHNVFIDGDGFIQENKINIIHLDKIDLNVQYLINELLLSYIWRIANAEQFIEMGGIYIFIDECQNCDTNKKSPLSLMLSEGRRLGINLILATQMLLQSTNNSVQQRLSQCALILYFKPSFSRIESTAKLIDSLKWKKWIDKLKTLNMGDFVAVGDFLLNNKQVNYPLVVTANIRKITDIDKKYDLSKY